MAALIAILLGDTVTSKHVIRIFQAKTFVPGWLFRIELRGIAVYILLPANWKTLWRYQQTLDDNGRGLMFEPSDSLHPFLEETTLLLPSKRFQIFLLPPSRLFPIHGLTIKRIRSFFVSLERASRRRLGDTPNHPPTSYSFSRLSRVSPKVLPKFSSFLNSIHSPGGRRV